MWFSQRPVASPLLLTHVWHLSIISVALTYLINIIFLLRIIFAPLPYLVCRPGLTQQRRGAGL